MDNNGRNSFLCRQSSTRWIPTADQIRILRELYYNNGVRSPTADQIQRISARLRQYGKIEGKNVFYWFQNHKARERQKKKLTMNCNDSSCSENKLYNTEINVPYHGFYDVGNNGYGGEQMFMERNLRESCLPIEHPTMPWNMYQYVKDQEEPPFMSEPTREIETLPLFPTRSKEEEHEEQSENEAHKFSFPAHNGNHCTQPNGYFPNYHNNHHNGAASLELTLNSFHYAPPGSM